MSRKSTIEVRAARAFSLKNYPLAIRHLGELLECVGENPQTLYMLAVCHARQDQHAQAFAAVRRALQADRDHLASIKLLARLHVVRGEHAEAHPLVARALELEDAQDDAGSGLRGWLASLTGRRHAAGAGRSPLPSLDANEDRQWREWARAYLARRSATDGGVP